MHSSLRKSLLVWGFLFLLLWVLSSGGAWATANAQGTVPTRVKSPTRPPATAAPIPSATRVPPSDTPVRVGPTAVPSTAIPALTQVPGTATLLPTQVPLVSPAPSVVMATASENLRIRAEPSTSAAVLGQLKKGESAPIAGRTAANDWWQIALPGNPNRRGWISTAFAVASGPVDGIPVTQAASSTATVASPRVVAAPPSATATIGEATPTLATPTDTVEPPATSPLPFARPRTTPTASPISSLSPDGTSGLLMTVVAGLILLGIAGGVLLVVTGGIMLWVGGRRTD